MSRVRSEAGYAVKRALVIVPYPLSDEGVENRADQLAAATLDGSVQFEFRAVKAAPKVGNSYHDSAIFEIANFEAGCTAESEGYDAVCLDTVSDCGLRPLRSLLRIPVVGAGSTSFYFALMLGRRFSIITQWKEWVRETEDQVDDLGLTSKCVSVRSIDIRPDPSGLLQPTDEVLDGLVEAGRRCVDDGADVICLGSTTMHRVHSQLAQQLPCPVINPGPLSYKVVELLLGSRLTHSASAYRPPEIPEIELLHTMLNAANALETGRTSVVADA